MAKVPAFGPLVGMPFAQPLKATSVEGLTVEAFGKLATSPGNIVTKPPEGPEGWTIVTLAITPVRSFGKVKLPPAPPRPTGKVWPLKRNRRVWLIWKGPAVTGVPSWLMPIGP